MPTIIVIMFASNFKLTECYIIIVIKIFNLQNWDSPIHLLAYTQVQHIEYSLYFSLSENSFIILFIFVDKDYWDYHIIIFLLLNFHLFIVITVNFKINLSIYYSINTPLHFVRPNLLNYEKLDLCFIDFSNFINAGYIPQINLSSYLTLHPNKYFNFNWNFVQS